MIELRPISSHPSMEIAPLPAAQPQSTPPDAPVPVTVDKAQQDIIRNAQSNKRDYFFPADENLEANRAADGGPSTDAGNSPVSPQHLRQMIATARKDLKRVQRSEAGVSELAQQLHKLLGAGIGEPDSYPASGLTLGHGRSIREIEEALSSAPEIKEAITTLLKKINEIEEQHGNLSLWERGRRVFTEFVAMLRDNFSMDMAKVILATALGVGVGKSAGWYAARKIIPSADVAFDVVVEMLAYIAKRYGISDPIAAFLEYIPTVYAQDLMKSIGGSMTNWQGMGGAFDAVGTIVSQAFTGSTNLREKALIGVTGFWNIVQTGALNNLWRLASGSKSVFNAITLPAAADPDAVDTAHGDNAFVDAEETLPGAGGTGNAVALSQDDAATEATRGRLPATRAESRALASKLGHLEKSFPNATLVNQAMTEHGDRIDTAQHSMEQLFAAINNINAAQVEGAEDGAEISTEAGLQVVQTMLDRLQHAREAMTSLAGAADPEEIGKLDQVLEALNLAKNDLANHGGRDPNTFYLIAGMAAMVTAFASLGFAGARLGSVLEQIPLRAALITLASGPGQTIGNAASYLFDVKAASQNLSRKLGIDASHASSMERLLKWGMAAAIISVCEFPLLETGIAFSDKAADLAGKIPESAANHPLTVPVIRGLQELYKAVAGPVVNRIMAGEALSAHHYIGMAGSALTQAAGIAWSMIESRQKEKVD